MMERRSNTVLGEQGRRSGGFATKQAIITTAERQFALQGLEAVSLRQIAIAADQRNESAAHYHFGSREGLIRAILGYRVGRINERRLKWLNGETGKRGLSLERFVASAIIYPMADEIFSDWRRCYWVRFITQLTSIESYESIITEFEDAWGPFAFGETYDLLKKIPDVDGTIMEVRREILSGHVVWGLAPIEALSFRESREVCELHVANLVDMMAASISVAPSAETLLKAEMVSKSDVIAGQP